MQQSRLLSVLFGFFAFAMLAFASPVAKTAGTDLALRGDKDGLDIILDLCLELQVKIKAILVVIAGLNVGANISVYLHEITVLIKAFVTACLNVTAVIDLSATVKIQAIAKVIAQIIIDISACIRVFVNVVVNLVALVELDKACQGMLLELNVLIKGILLIIAKLCVNINIHASLVLTLTLKLLGLITL